MTHALLLAALVVIRTYTYAPMSDVDLRHARETADRAFARAGISLRWIDCRTAPTTQPGAADDPACAAPLREGSEFVLRLMPSPPTTGDARRLAMGSSVIDHDAAGGALITIDPTLVSQIAQASSADFATLLGRSIAHEIGHLLLGHARHSRAGLMRAVWSQDELRGIRPVDWGFSRAEGAEMRQGLATRARSAN